MKKRTLCITATALAIALPLLAAERLGVNTGLWENTTTIHIAAPMPADFANLPAAQRTQMEEMMKQMGLGAPRTITGQSCITQKDLEGNAFGNSMEDAGQACDFKQVSATSKRQEYTFQCKGEQGDANGRMVIDAVSDTRVRGTMDATMPTGRMDLKFEAAWKGADCGSVKPE